jgi:hypothetical protein
LLIPVMEVGSCSVRKSNVVSGYNERGFTALWNAEEAWVKK